MKTGLLEQEKETSTLPLSSIKNNLYDMEYHFKAFIVTFILFAVCFGVFATIKSNGRMCDNTAVICK